MTPPPRFLRQYRKVVARNPSPEAFGDYLEGLDASAWKEVLEALLITRTPAVYEVIAPRPGANLVDAAARLFEQASPASMRHYGAALDALLTSVLRSLGDELGVEVLTSGLELMEMLPDYSSPDLPREIMSHEKLPRDLRVTAALAIAERDDARVDWKEIDVTTAEFLLPAVICGLTYTDPREAIHAVVRASRPYNFEMLKYPLRMAIRRLIRVEGPYATEELLETIPSHHWSQDLVFRDVLSALEFTAYRAQVAARHAAATETRDENRSIALVLGALAAANDIWKGLKKIDVLTFLTDTKVGARMEDYRTRLTATPA